LRSEPAAATPFVETMIATGVTDARNAVAVLNGGAVIAVDGGPGALSELGHALTLGKPVTGIDTHRVDSVVWIEHVGTPQRRSTTSKPASEL
jgi:predicted Rossmann-fold nucleotide-binding protein